MTDSDKNNLRNRLLENLKLVEQEDKELIDSIRELEGERAAGTGLYGFAMGVISAWIELDLEYLGLLGKVNKNEVDFIKMSIAAEWSSLIINK